MKLWGVAMVRNEADIIEAFIRHNLSLLDGLFVVDHGSADHTLDILCGLAAEGLPLTILRSEDPRFVQAEVVTDLTRRVLSERQADFVFPLDADEFIKTPSRSTAESALAAVPAGAHAQLHWQTYVPDFEAPEQGLRRLIDGARRADVEIHGHYKLAVGRHLLAHPTAILTQGLHYVVRAPNADLATRGPHARIRASALAIAHVPLRSVDQYVSKVVVKKLGRIAAANNWTRNSAMQAAYDRLRQGEPVDPASMNRVASNWTVPVERWIEPGARNWVRDPFLVPFPQRITPPRPSHPVPVLLDALLRLVERLRAMRQGPPPGGGGMLQ